MSAEAIFSFVVLVLDLIVLGYTLARLVDAIRTNISSDSEAAESLHRLHQAHRRALQEMHRHRQ